jgi:glycerol-3-phosphate dehydrogenase subunit B
MSANGCEVLVIGEGLSGVMAAATAAQEGRRVTLVSKGPGSFVLGPAVANFRGLPAPIERSAIEEAATFFVNLASSAQYGYGGGARESRLVPTILGTFQEVSVAPRSLWQADPGKVKRAVVAGIANLPNFDANFLVERFSSECRQMDIETAFRSAVVTLPHNPKHPLTALELANHVDRDPAYRSALVSVLRPIVRDADLLIIPGILGTKSSDADLVCLEEEVGCRVCELATLPPSVPGMRLFRRLEARLAELRVDIYTGFAAQVLHVEGGRCVSVELETPGRPRHLKAEQFVLACGRFTSLLESIPVEFSGCGSSLGNLFRCGSLADPVEPRHRNAISILTGYEAGMLASRQGVQYAGR